MGSEPFVNGLSTILTVNQKTTNTDYGTEGVQTKRDRPKEIQIIAK